MTPYFEADGVTLYHGDCLEVMAGMAAGSVDAILTDLPYGTTACSWDNVIPFAQMWAGVKHVLKPRGVFVTTASQPFTSALVMSNAAWFKYEWIWEKSQATGFLDARRKPLRDYENIIVFCDGQSTYNPQIFEKPKENVRPHTKTDRVKQRSLGRDYTYDCERTVDDGVAYPRRIIKFSNVQGASHPTQKPVALYEYLIRTYTNPGELVADICTGSGTTAIAAIRTGRNFVGAELEERYCEIAARRIERELQQPRLFTEATPAPKPEQGGLW